VGCREEADKLFFGDLFQVANGHYSSCMTDIKNRDIQKFLNSVFYLSVKYGVAWSSARGEISFSNLGCVCKCHPHPLILMPDVLVTKGHLRSAYRSIIRPMYMEGSFYTHVRVSALRSPSEFG
jgi:hypothetical protein